MSGPAAGGLQGAAIVGMACRFPGAADVERFWQNLVAGVESITFFSAAELLAAGVPAATLAAREYVRAKAVIAEPDRFDAALFGLSPREAEILDPQHRLLLECAWQALDDAGHDPRRYPGPIGVFAGAGTNTYLLSNLQANHEALAAAGPYQVMLGSDDHFLATRLSYLLGLRGPSLTVQTACSSSLVAAHLAVQSVLVGECDMALAGGVRVSVPQVSGHWHQPGGIFSPDGHCRPFDAAAAGSIDGDGAGVVVIKRLADALADGDRVRAVILGSAVNNDGAQKVGYTAPSVAGQAEAIAMALAVAGVEPASIGYVEAHGTATPLGDPIEVAALEQVFGEAPGGARRRSCALGSVKGNIGHLDAAAGVASLIKAVLAVERGEIPPTLHFTRPNPQLDLDGGPFFVNTRPAAWHQDLAPRRAGVSSFGIGGTNAHLVLEEPPAAAGTEPAAGPGPPRHLLVLSAATATALEAATAGLAAHLELHPGLDLADVAYTLQVGRRVFPHRRALAAGDTAEAAAALRSLDPRRVLSRVQEPVNRQLAFLFPGQGAQHPGMGEDLYRSEPTFRRAVDRAAETLEPVLGTDLRQALFPAPGGERQAAAARLRQTALAQPALFAVEHALALLWMERGVRPDALLGHSLGEYVAACLAGVIGFEDALRLVAERGRLMQELPGGAMLAVPLPEAELRPWIEEEVAAGAAGLALAVVNTPALCVAAGGETEIDRLAARLLERRIETRRLHTSHAFHSPAMEPAVDRFVAAFAGVRLAPPAIPFVSNLTGAWIRPEEATDPVYWGRQMRECVRFSSGLEALFSRGDRVLLEVGPGRSLAALARRHPRRAPGQLVLASLPAQRSEREKAGGEGGGVQAGGAGAVTEQGAMTQALGELWLAGVEVDWPGVHAHRRRLRVALPSYPFERRRYWLEPPAAGAAGAPAPAGIAARPSAEAAATNGKDHMADWFWAPLWQQTLPIGGTGAAAAADAARWLVFAADDFGRQLGQRLAESCRQVTVVVPGDRYRQVAPGEVELRPEAPEDYRELLAATGWPERIAHAWSVDPAPDAGRQCELGFYSLLALARALAEWGGGRSVHVGILSAGAQRVAGETVLAPAKAALLGAAAVLPQEIPGLTCQAIDLVPPPPGSRGERELIGLLIAELDAEPAEPVVAYRGTDRWVRTFEALRLGAAPPASTAPPRLRQGGTYLITGGLGGVGLELAAALARSAGARLVLTGRTAFPPRAAWPALAGQGDDAAARQARRLLEIEGLGAEILVLQADVTDREAMRRALDQAHRRFGPLHGVIHAAGVAGGGLAELRTSHQARAVLAPKVDGTLILAELLAGEELDLFVLCSSLNAILGGPGQVDYAAANAFLGAFAEASAATARWPVLAIDWDTWRGVGMAADAGGAGLVQGSRTPGGNAGLVPGPGTPGGSAGAAGAASGFKHPLFSGRAAAADAGGSDDAIFVSHLRADSTWILDEHRLGGTPVVPGTAYLEMAGAAFRAVTGGGGPANAGAPAFELRNVAFLAPLAVSDGEIREVRTVLGRDGDGYRFAVRSRTAAGAWQEHAVGMVGAAAGDAAPRRDLPALLAGRRSAALGAAYREGLRQSGLGPRWEGLRTVWVGGPAGAGEGVEGYPAVDEVIGLLELAPELAGDLDDLYLHPALLDAATSFAETWVQRAGGDYLPLSYKRLRVFGPLPRRFYSHVRLSVPAGSAGAAGVDGAAPAQAVPAETLAFDISIVDEQGCERVRVEEFTLKRIDAARAIRAAAAWSPGVAPPGTATGAAPPGGTSAGEAPAEPLEGMAPAEAVEAFHRILAGPPLPRIAVSVRALPEEIARARWATAARLAAAAAPPSAGVHDRPDLATPYLGPRDPLEGQLAALFESVLGIARVGVDDDFFALGGHSLLGTQLLSRIRDELRVELPLGRLFDAPTAAGLAALVLAERTSGAPVVPEPVPRAPRGGDLPLSFAQERLWFLDRLQPGNPFYNVSQTARLDGLLDVPALAGSLREIVRRHEALRTAFVEVDGGAVQRVIDPGELPPPRLPFADLTALPAARRDGESERLAVSVAAASFDLAQPPLLALVLVRKAPDRHLLALAIHHIVSDGWSIGVLLGELAANYRALAAGQAPALPELPVQYADYAVWQRRRLAGPELAYQIAAWRARLAPPLPVLDLPTDLPRPPARSFRGASEHAILGPPLTAALQALCRGESATLFMGLLAAFAALLARHTGQGDLLIGTPVAGRDRRELEGLIGVLLNTVVLRADLTGEPTFRELVRRLRAVTLDAFSRQEVPFEQLVQELRPERDPSRTPLFQVMFNMQDFPPQDFALPGLRLTGVPLREAPARFDLTLYAAEVEGEVRLELEHSADLFERATAARWLARLQTLLAAAVGADLAVDDLPLLPEAEQEQLRAWGGGGAARVENEPSLPAARRPPAAPGAASIHGRFVDVARSAPGAVALAAGGQRLTYGDLDRLSLRLARRLRALGVGPETRVAVALERGPGAIVAMLATLRAGGAYVPLDPAAPPSRRAWMIEDSGAEVVIVGLAEAQVAGATRRLQVVELSAADLATAGGDPLPEGPPSGSAIEPPAGDALPPPDPEALAYVLYTSGSTGVPKGVAVPHRAVLRLIDGDCAELGPDEVWAQLAPLSFDAATLEIWGALLHGGRLEILPDAALEPRALGGELRRRGVTALWLTAGLFQLVADEALAELGTLRQLLAGGDVLGPDAVRRTLAAHPRLRLVNGYGPTENTTFTCCCRLVDPAQIRASVPIGWPIAGTCVRVLDSRLRPVPIGVPGELCAGGLGLARGYLGRPELTAERFVPDPGGGALGGGGARLYRTGDRVRYRPDGALEFLGRLDRQVKIRGFRVEPEEVEAVLAAHPGVRQAAVAVREERTGGRRLVGYAVPHLGAVPAVTAAAIAEWLGRRLPPYMVPAALVLAADLPLTPNGKLDRRRLPPPPDEPTLAAPPPFAPPATATERRVAAIWQEVLEVPRIGRQDRFFDLGGHSLLVLRAASRLRAAFHVEVPVRLLFEAPALADVAAWIEREQLARADRAELEALLDELETRAAETAADGVAVGDESARQGGRAVVALASLEPLSRAQD